MVLPDKVEDYIFGTGKSDNFSGLVGMVAMQVSRGGGDSGSSDDATVV